MLTRSIKIVIKNKIIFFLSFLFSLFCPLCSLLMISPISYAASCSPTKTTCVEKGGTRYFDGVPVDLPCWKYQITQECTVKSDNNCAPLRNEGCTQIGASCKEKLGDICVVQNKTYQCPVETCKDTDGIICGGEYYCMNGKCSAITPTQNKNFGKDSAEMAAVNGSAEDVKKQNSKTPMIFTGQRMECSEDALGFSNCCRNTGWGKDINLAHCSDQEKALGKAKEKGLVIPAPGKDGDWKYCHNKVLGVCTSHHKVYCVFNSKIARIIQRQGRWQQLHISFGHVGGSHNHANCRGLTIAELQKIDFSKINFSDIYNDIKNNVKLPDKGGVESKVIERIKEFYHNGSNS